MQTVKFGHLESYKLRLRLHWNRYRLADYIARTWGFDSDAALQLAIQAPRCVSRKPHTEIRIDDSDKPNFCLNTRAKLYPVSFEINRDTAAALTDFYDSLEDSSNPLQDLAHYIRQVFDCPTDVAYDLGLSLEADYQAWKNLPYDAIVVCLLTAFADHRNKRFYEHVCPVSGKFKSHVGYTVK